ncbi:ion channel [Bradyrhizobium canariense]|uniref:ion channel n=1 Tax=Bradyrhizobium canariense TaxID=255045 RepID=UPI000A18D450|nr:ion channel [Bradyrhizobium canariense]OSI20474.1 hypothetical protein BST65_32335 [Bradyrhizobium canariense]OSI33393.1 hypothetical protein BST66_13305 [Bradyrhizobium canariense]OSI39612.1 hypothetical protein BSZ20_29170 [Bradyrhizobium canariense]OSI47636.1 hypothetical protein BST67_19650 [Bradyrhizobium canariense]OSI55979.1 hypothetical protein BSZ15_18150 [Bradyrhizobium canariense]
MIIQTIEIAAGIVLVVFALRDVFDTVVVPGESRGALRVARRLLGVMLPIWKWARRGKSGVSTSFAPSILMGSFLIWMVLLWLGFGLIAHALGDWFAPPADFPEALFIVGSALCTVGLSGIEAHGPARWVLVLAGLSGLSVLTMAVTYLLQVQEGISRRDAGILKLTTAAGQPPSALGLLERYADLDSPEEIRRVLDRGRDWCASVLQSHASHPSLIYFKSAAVGAGWPATLGAMMDLALMFELLIDEPATRAPAVLLRSEGLRLLDELNGLVGLQPASDDTTAATTARICARLTAAGYKVRSSVDAAEFAERRRKHAARVRAAADHLGTLAAPLTP